MDKRPRLASGGYVCGEPTSVFQSSRSMGRLSSASMLFSSALSLRMDSSTRMLATISGKLSACSMSLLHPRSLATISCEVKRTLIRNREAVEWSCPLLRGEEDAKEHEHTGTTPLGRHTSKGLASGRRILHSQRQEHFEVEAACAINQHQGDNEMEAVCGIGEGKEMLL